MNGKKLVIGFYAHGLTFNGNTLKESSLGGSETALLYMARELAKRGHDVKVFNNCDKPGRYDGVDYFDYRSQWRDIAPIAEWDVFIVSRNYTVLGQKMNARLVGLWNHDVVTDRRGLMQNMWGADFAWCLSQFHEEQFLSTAKEIRPILHRTRNGIDLELIDSVRARVKERDKNVFVWGSRPERGLDILLQRIWPRILKEVNPDAQLKIAGYSDKGLDLPNEIKEYHAFMQQLVLQSPNTKHVGHLTKEQYYELLASSGMLVYPTMFPEISCITALEAQACELPIITSNEFALKETVKDRANLIQGHPHSEEYQNSMIARISKLTKSGFDYKQTQRIGREHVIGYYEWKTIAEEWEEFFWDKFKERSQRSGGRKTIQKLIYNSDLLAANWALENSDKTGVNLQECSEVLTEVKQHLKRHHENPELYDEGDKVDIETYTEWDKLGRFSTAVRHIKKHFEDKPFTLVDIGCGVGGFLAKIMKSFPGQAQVMGFDFSAGLANRAIALIQKNFPSAGDPSSFIFADDFMKLDVPKEDMRSDCAFAGEWLEHQIDLYGALERMEAWVKPDGLGVITIPSGPWEAISYKKNEQRGVLERSHVSHFEFRDIEELFKTKEFSMEYFPVGISPIGGELLGNWIVSWKVDHKPFGKIDYLRKFQTTRPYQWISACLITKNEEDNITRCLKSIHEQVDEIIVLDTGSTDNTVELAKKWATKVEEVKWPEDFSEARNMGIALAKPDADWIYWMDADEVLIGQQGLRKYLNNDLFNGYVITQNHLTIDAGIVKPDVPVRIYRNGVGIKFYGAIHEHCEFALDKPIDPVLILGDVKILHYGYMTESIRRWKCKERNLPLLIKDREKYPNRLLGIVLMMRDYLNASQWEIEDSRGITERIAKFLRETIRLQQTFFTDETHMYYDLSYSLYQRALEFLGKNSIPVTDGSDDVPFQIYYALGGAVGGMTNPEDVIPISHWFHNRHELMSFMSTRAFKLSETLKLPSGVKKK